MVYQATTGTWSICDRCVYESKCLLGILRNVRIPKWCLRPLFQYVQIASLCFWAIFIRKPLTSKCYQVAVGRLHPQYRMTTSQQRAAFPCLDHIELVPVQSRRRPWSYVIPRFTQTTSPSRDFCALVKGWLPKGQAERVQISLTN